MPQKNRGRDSRAEDTSSTRNAAEGRRKAAEAYKGKGGIRGHHRHKRHGRNDGRGRSRAGTRKEHHAMERNQATDTEEREGRRRYLHWAADNLTDEQAKALAICAAQIGRAENAEQQKDLAILIGFYNQFTPQNQKAALESMRDLCRVDNAQRYQEQHDAGGN